MRWIASLVIAAAAIASIEWYVVHPLRCNYVEGEVQRVSESIMKSSASQVSLAPYARRSIERLMPCLDCSNGVNRKILLAVNLGWVGRKQEALALLRDAMRYDRRPDLYKRLGDAQIEAGEEAEGLQNLITACRLNPDLIDDVTYHHDEIRRAIDNYYLELVAAKKKRSGT